MWRMEWCRVVSISMNEQSMYLHITIKEFIPIMIAVMICGHKWQGCNIVVNCDNEAVVVVLGRRYSKEPHLMHMLWVLFFAEVHYQFKLSAQHILGICNTLADHLSRNQLHEFYKKSSSANRHSSHIRTFLSSTVAIGQTNGLDIQMLDPDLHHFCE